MFWPVIWTCVFALAGGSAAFWAVTTFKPPPGILVALSPLVMIAIPPEVAAGLLSGGWLAEAFFLKNHEGMAAPDESLGWRRVVLDALGTTVAFLVGLIYMYRERRGLPVIVLAVGVSLAFGLALCYFQATAGNLPRQLRVKHGYAVGFFSFLPWAYLLAKLGWPVFCLGFLTFFILPPFFLATVDLRVRLTRPIKRRRRMRSRTTIRLPSR